MEVALVPGMLALGESIACQIMYSAVEYESNTARGQPSQNTSRSHAGIYSKSPPDATKRRTHSGIYCNPGATKRVLPAVAERRSYDSESSHSRGSENVYPESLSPRSVSETDSPCPTARLMMPEQAFAQPSEAPRQVWRPVTPDFGTHAKTPGCSPYTAGLQMRSQEQSCRSTSGNCFSTPPQTYLPPLSLKNVSSHEASASNGTCSTCSDLDTSSTVSTVSFNLSNASVVQSSRSVCEDVESCQLGSPEESKPQIAVGVRPVDQKEVSSAKPPSSKARAFCREAFANCDLDNLEDEMADVTKDLEALRASMASSKRSLYLLNFDK